MKHISPLDTEAVSFGRYLIGRPPTVAHVELYKRSTPQSPPAGTYAAAIRHPLLLPYLDAHDAFFRPSSQLRQRLYLMFSILEASPHNTELFLPQQRSAFYLFTVIGFGIRSVFRLALGTILVKMRGWQ